MSRLSIDGALLAVRTLLKNPEEKRDSPLQAMAAAGFAAVAALGLAYAMIMGPGVEERHLVVPAKASGPPVTGANAPVA